VSRKVAEGSSDRKANLNVSCPGLDEFDDFSGAWAEEGIRSGDPFGNKSSSLDSAVMPRTVLDQSS